MDDRNLMENLLILEKGACDLFMHGTIESPTPKVRETFKKSLSESLCMQDSIYSKMQQKGWYPTERVEQNKISNVKQKFSSASN
jgi:spore coat protein CotF